MKTKCSVILKQLQHLPIGKILLFLFLFYLLLLVVPYISHKKVSSTYQQNFDPEAFYSDSTGSERIAYINDNDDALLYRLNMIEHAQEEIILSTFDFNADQSGKDVLAALMDASKRGVSVRVIVDGTSGLLNMQGNEYFQAFASCPNVSVKIYNKIHFLKPYDMQARLHDKYVIIDNSMYLLGGRNTDNRFLGSYSKSQNIDRELFVYNTKKATDSSSITQLRTYFESVWNLKDSKAYLCKRETEKIKIAKQELFERIDYLKETYAKSYTDWNYNELTMSTNKVTLLSNPIETENKEPLLWYSLQKMMEHAETVTIYTPYIICGKEMYQGLYTLKEKEIPVEIITNDVASGANPWGCTDYLNQKEKIWDTGAKVYEFMGAHSCHTKAFLLDDRISVIGSYNFDMRSTYQDTELMLAVDCPELNSIIRKEAEYDKTCSKIIGPDGEYIYGENYVAKDLSTGKRLFYRVLRILIPPIRRFL